MSKTLKFYIVDVFAQEKYTGNQLAVFIVQDFISSAQMQKIAAEIGFSETTFVYPTPTSSHSFEVRIFTPKDEIPFAGHPTLGTSWVIREKLLQEESERIVLDLSIGEIPVTFHHRQGHDEILWMKQRPPSFDRIIPKEEIIPVLKLDPEDIHPDFPVHEVSTGLPYFIVPLKSLDAAQKASIDQAAYDAFVDMHNPETDLDNSQEKVLSSAFFIFTNETCHSSNDIHARMFDPLYGVPEDAATGSANGCLLAYLIKHRYFGAPELNLTVEQGYEMNRPSHIELSGHEGKNGNIEIFVGGAVHFLAQGEWNV